ncbi:MAG: prephenate dehydrogenase/arogenate dehydrogenase family protein [Thermoplasmata archaeon]|nr:prephenate dehydrogenase/arogenate dehydrogenase family protein [Thermoplasmata archaeon]
MELNEIRDEIGDIDRQLLSLMKRRLELAKLVGENKVKTGAAVRNIAQENNVIDRYRGFALENGMNPVYAEKVCRVLMQESIEVQAALPRPASDARHIAIVGGYGKMGRWMADMLRQSGHRVDIIDPSAGNGLTVDDAKWADAVIVSIPISRTGQMLRKLDGICKPEALIFDVASLKSPFIEELRDLGSRRRVCSVHPMFGPSAESMYNRNVVVCDCGSKEAVDEALALLGNHGANIRVMPVEEHDRYMSYVLGLGHAVNIAFFTVLERSGISYRDMQSVASTTYDKMMDTNLSVALEDPYLYYEIQHMNANGTAMLKAFDQAVNDVVDAALSDDPRAFKDLMDRGREYFT